MYSYADYFELQAFGFFISWAVIWRLLEWRQGKFKDLALGTAFFLILGGYAVPIVPSVIGLLSVDQNKTMYPITYIVTKLADITHSFAVTVGNPLLGANSTMGFADVTQKIMGWFQTGNFPVLKETTAEYIREIGVNEVKNDIESKIAIAPGGLLNDAIKQANRFRNVVAFLVLAVCYYSGGTFSVFCGVITYLIYNSASDVEPDIIVETEYSTLRRDGIYIITQNLLGFPYAQGVGVVSEGVMHIPYHVCFGANITTGRSVMKPSYISTRKDLVTYGGFACYGAPKEGETLLINTERRNGRSTYTTKCGPTLADGTFTWPGVTEPGESGSPVFVQRDGNLHLVGQAGQWVRTNDTDKTEYCATPAVVQTQKMGELEILVLHPGAGKTRTHIPNIVKKAFIETKGRILISGPTRVVCSEIYEALQGQGMIVGLNIKDRNQARKPNARIQIAAHNTMLRLLMESDPLVAKPSCIIVDEVHFRDAATIMLTEMAKYLSEHGVRVTLMSATYGDKFAEGSRHTITEVEIRREEMEIVLKDELEKGRRVMVFLPGLKSKESKELIKRFMDHNPILLSRNTFEAAMRDIKHVDRRLIFSTDIAECGINVDELDSVIDTRTKFSYALEGVTLQSGVRPISRASMIQRRGRVGRSRAGMYYYVNLPITEVGIDSAELDATVMMTHTHWAPGKSNPFGITLSQKQVVRALTEGLPPTQISLQYDPLGIKISDMTDNIKEWRNSNNEYPGCGQCNLCLTTCKWYDERLHDWLVKDQPTKKIYTLD